MNNKRIGDAGEYFVAGELSRRNYIVALTTSGTEYFDLLVVSPTSNKKYAIQVKTTTNKRSWLLSKKNEDIVDEDFFYVFVYLNNLELPTYYIVPSEVVANGIIKSHQEWLELPNKKGGLHKDNSIREFKNIHDKYLNNWDLLK